MFWKIEIKDKPGIFDAIGESIKKDILDLGIKTVGSVRFVQVYTIEGSLSETEIRKICEELLVDKVSQVYSLNTPASRRPNRKNDHIIEVAYNPGVMDPVEESTLKGIRDLGINSVDSVRTARKYLIKGSLTPIQLKTISEKLLYNKLIQHVVKSQRHNVTRKRFWLSVSFGYSGFVKSQ